MNLLQTLHHVVANKIQSGSTGLPVSELTPGNLAEDLPLGKAKAAIGYTIVTEDGTPVTEELDLLLSTQPAALDLSLQVHLVIAADRVGLTAGEIMEALKKALAGSGILVGEDWTVGLQLEEARHVGYNKSRHADHFSANFAMVLIKPEQDAK